MKMGEYARLYVRIRPLLLRILRSTARTAEGVSLCDVCCGNAIIHFFYSSSFSEAGFNSFSSAGVKLYSLSQNWQETEISFPSAMIS